VSALAVRPDHHDVRWLTAAPLWGTLLADEDPTPEQIDRMQRPALLRLTSDDFMDDLAALLGNDPSRLPELEARPRSYRTPPPGADDEYEPPIDHVKLYQPVHGHFNLVASTLVCRIAGLPDKAVDAATKETVSFVLRRLGAEGGELAWTGKAWLEVSVTDTLAAGEQLVPMFPLPYTERDRRRRLFVGLLPTSSIESFTSGGAVSLSPQAGDRVGDPPDRRLEILEDTIVTPYDALREMSNLPVEASRFLLLDLAEFLRRYVPQLWDAVQNRQEPAPSSLRTAYRRLRDSWADVKTGASWLDALIGVWAERDRIWGETSEAPKYEVNLARHGTGAQDLTPDALRSTLTTALPARTEADKQEPSPPFAAPKLDPRPETRYVVRCVYRRPLCGPLHPDVVSDPSEPFEIAGFFDLDAPARQINITLPIDTSIAGLRKAKKNVNLLISNQLRSQLKQVADAKKALKGDVDDAVPVDLGMICSFSIPIITICALVVLMIFLILLNLVFFWLPFFRICFPIPVKKG
jgi:hypothetical protein